MSQASPRQKLSPQRHRENEGSAKREELLPQRRRDRRERKETAARYRVAVVGPTGYTGAELFAGLLRHPGINEVFPIVRDGPAGRGIGRPLAQLLPRLTGLSGAECVAFSPEWLLDRSVALVFLSTPPEVSLELVPPLLERGIRVVDLSAAFRLSSAKEFERWYGTAQGNVDRVPPAPTGSGRAVYGLPELHAQEIASASLVANPGCYPTSVLLALLPLRAANWMDLDRGIVCDCKSGVSGAGKEPRADIHFCEVGGNFRAYNLFRHRHTPEILEQAGLAAENLIFSTHLLPVRRGILSSIYIWLRERREPEEVESLFRSCYAGKPLVRILGSERLPELQYVVGTNFCDLGFALDETGKRLVVVSCLDNLGKGAAGQAMQNMNLMLGFPEQEGLL